MKPRSNLLQEAVADAQTIRDTAIANARQQLADLFEPQLKTMLSTKLREQNEMDSSGIGSAGFSMDSATAPKPSKASNDSTDLENPDQEFSNFDDPDPKIKSVNEDTFPDDEDDKAHAHAPGVGAPAAPVAPVADMGAPGMGAPDMGAPDMGGADMGAPDMGNDLGSADDMGGADELDLDAIIRELEADVAGAGAGAGIPTEGFNNAQAGVDPQGALNGPTFGKTHETVDHGTSAKGIDTDSQGKTLPEKDGVAGGKEAKPGQEFAEHPMMEELDLDEILREVEADEEKPWNKKGDDSDKIATENVDLRRELREHRDVIVFLKGKINESNMLNAKLLYTNKLFRGFELNGKQKLQIVETFDRATTQREVKLIYTTLAESLNGKPVTKIMRKQNTTSITEGLASKPVGSTKPSQAQTLNENTSEQDNDMRARLQKLAGIKIL